MIFEIFERVPVKEYELVTNIRPFHEADLDRVLDIAAAAWRPIFESSRDLLGSDLFHLVVPDPDARKRSRVAAQCAVDSGTLVWVAVEDGEVVGFVTANLDTETLIGEISNNAVDPGRQGRGIGVLMYEHALAEMKEAGMLCATVLTGADPAHASARRAYEKVGFSRSVPSVQYYMGL